MEQKSGAQISQKAFIQSLLILLALMIVAGVLTLVIPAGQYQRVEVDGRETLLPDSFGDCRASREKIGSKRTPKIASSESTVWSWRSDELDGD